MDGQGNMEHYIFPKNPHTQTNAEVQTQECPDSSFPPLPGTAPILSFALRRSHPIVKRWDEVSKRVVELLDQDRISWIAIECFRRSQWTRPGDDYVTLFITLKEAPPITDRFSEIIGEIHDLSNVYIEVVQGKIWPYTSKAMRGPMPYSIQTPMGGSIGVDESSGASGTVGGFLELFKGEESAMYGLTCHHVVKPPGGLGNPEASDRVFHPSSTDHAVNVAIKKAYIQSWKNEKERLEEITSDMQDFKRSQKNLRKASSAIMRSEMMLGTMESFDSHIGRLVACSGALVSDDGHRGDWAVIELKSSRGGQNTYLSSDGAIHPLQDFHEPITNTEVTKFGRSTGRTYGEVNAVESVISNDGAYGGMQSREWAILPTEHGRYPPFASLGDSGSFVVSSDEPYLIGMVRGGSECSMAVYMTPIESVAKQILAKTSWHVRLPDGDGSHICCS